MKYAKKIFKKKSITYVFPRTAFSYKFRRRRTVDDENTNGDMRSTRICANPTSGRRRRLISSSHLKFPNVLKQTFNNRISNDILFSFELGKSKENKNLNCKSAIIC